MNNTGDITNSAIFLNIGGRGFARRFGDAQDSYYTKVQEAIDRTAENRDREKKAFVQRFSTDNRRVADEVLKEEELSRRRLEDEKKRELDAMKPLIDARKATYEKTKQMRYDLTLLENKYHNYIIKNIDNLPQKIAALKKAFIYIRNKKLADKELSLKKKAFFKKQMDNFIKEWDKLNGKGNIKLQALRTMYKLNLDISLKKENEDRINAKFATLLEQLDELKLKLQLEQAKVNKNQKKIDEYTSSIDNIEKIFPSIINKEKEAAQYIEKVDTFYDRFINRFGNILNFPSFP